jgi:GTP-binding protein
MAKSAHTFIDEVEITVHSGAGGNGCVHFRREKYVARGGPDGGDGGRGGDVVLVADRGLSTLQEFRRKRELSADRGQDGAGKRKDGSDGRTCEIRVPVGTIVYDADDDRDEPRSLADLSEHEQRYVAARGGNGGWGNVHFKTPTRQAPDFANPGQPSVTRRLRLSLKLLADVGIIGFPNAGKSTLLSRISAARPKIASYPFTTLVPSLGVVEVDDRRFVVADVPGLIEGASEGAGLGDRFLRHVERTRVLVHLLDVAAMLVEGRDLLADYDAIRTELGRYRPELLERHEIVAINKTELLTDAEDAKRIDEVERELSLRGCEVLRISNATGEGVPELIVAMLRRLDEMEQEDGDEREHGSAPV